MSAHSHDVGPTPPSSSDDRADPPTFLLTTQPAGEEGRTPTPRTGPAGGRPFGPYELLEEIDRGGMGVVFRARQHGLDRLVALKMILAGPAAQREEVLRFQREARAPGKLQHPNIIAIHDAGQIDGQYYFTMPLARGGSLSRHVRRLGAGPRAAVVLTEKVARAVQHMHQHDILHRDLKPANILLDAGDEPWVADFGLAKLLSGDELLTRPGSGLGTPAYMAPEQADRRLGPLGAAADVWSLGVILYELLAGRRPFRGRRETVIDKICNDEPARLCGRVRAIDAGLEAVVLKCLRKEPARRYATAGALADDLARWLRGERPLARPEGALGRSRRWVRRHVAALAVAVALLAGLGLGLTFALAGRRPVPAAPPVVMPPPSTEEMLRQQLEELRAGRPVTLIGETGGPAHSRALLGRLNTWSGPDESFTAEGFDLSLLELLPSPGVKGYRFEAEVDHEVNRNGWVGLFFGLTRHGEGAWEEKYWAEVVFDDVNYRDREKTESEVHFDLRHYRPHRAEPRVAGIDETWVNPQRDRMTFVPAHATGRGRRKESWRRLAVVVTPAGVRAFWEGRRLGDWSAADLAALVPPPDPGEPSPAAPPAVRPDGALGFLIYQGRASFRNVVVTPLGPDDLPGRE